MQKIYRKWLINKCEQNDVYPNIDDYHPNEQKGKYQ